MGTFSIVQLLVSTSIYSRPLEGIVVQNLLYDAILHTMKSDTVKSIRVNLSSASINVEHHLPSDLQIQPASFSVDLNPVLQNVTSGVSSDSSCGDGADAPHSDGASALSDVDVDASHGEASRSRIVDNGLPDSSDVGTPFDAETDSPSAVDFDATHVEASRIVVDDGPPDTNEVGTPFDVETDSPCAVRVSNQIQKGICDKSNILVGKIVGSHVQDPAISNVLINYNSFFDREGNLNPNSFE